MGFDDDSTSGIVGLRRVALIGIPTDEGSSLHRGPALAPAAIRRQVATGSSNAFAENLKRVFDGGLLEDLGDVDLKGTTGLRQIERIEEQARAWLQDGYRLLSLGGDHTVTWPLLRAHSQPGLTVLHIDAHPDLYDEFEGSRLSHACPFARIMEESLCEHLVQIGIRTLNPHQAEQARRFGVEIVTMRDWPGKSLEMRAPIYLSIDLDGLDPAFAPGVSHPEAGGLTSREVIDLIQRLPHGSLIGADIVELNPLRDLNDITAALCVKLVKELATKLAEA